MIDYFNPFEYEGANRLSTDKICDFYIEDFNYSRFVRSKRNIILVGARGTGKTMTLMYNSLPVQIYKAEKNNEKVNLSHICIHVPCNTSLNHKQEWVFLNEFQASLVSEHFLVIAVAHEIVDSISKIPLILDNVDLSLLVEEINYSFDTVLPQTSNFFENLKLFIQKESRRVQTIMNQNEEDIKNEIFWSFSSGVLPVVNCLKKIPALKNTHLSLMLDDAHDLNIYQIKAVNTWIAYRDNSTFSFKVALANYEKPLRMTRSGGAILEGHDFTQIDMDQPYQNKNSSFGKLARKIVTSRLIKVGIEKSPEEFFPTSLSFKRDLDKCEKELRAKAIEIYGIQNTKKINDHVYKYSRAKYFRDRLSSKSNRPPYSGFDTLVHLSTGNIRNLLNPCYQMFDTVISEKHNAKTPQKPLEAIPPHIQRDVILEQSTKKWEFMANGGLARSITNCSGEQALQIYQLFNQLTILFRNRLIQNLSEPRAVTFSISEKNYVRYRDIKVLLKIAQEAQILYSYRSSAKDSGQRETYYVPNRILLIERGLDPHGQHARVSIKASHLWEAAKNNKQIPSEGTRRNKNEKQYNMF